MGRDGSNPAAPFILMMSVLVMSFGSVRSEAEEIDRMRARAAAALDDSLAAVGGRAAVITVMTGDVVPVAGLRRCVRSDGGIADDLGWLA
jgi:hypothetical protein